MFDYKARRWERLRAQVMRRDGYRCQLSKRYIASTEGCTGCDEPGEGCIVDEIDSFSAADVAPVRRGRWLDGVEDSMLRICSLCGFTAGAPSHRFCPACGAKMEVDYEN